MKIKVITFASREAVGLTRLKKSLEMFGYDYHVILGEWKGFGTKLLETYEYVKTIKDDYDGFIFVDAYDVVALGPSSSFQLFLSQERYGMLVSAEKGCWPDKTLKEYYDKHPLLAGVDTPWRYVNSGLYYSNCNLFIRMIKENMPKYADDDQLWLSKRFLSEKYPIRIDTGCVVFQSVAFEKEDDFEYHSNFLYNKKTSSQPTFVHGNGKTYMGKVNAIAFLNSLDGIKTMWRDEEGTHKYINDALVKNVNESLLKDHRDWVENNVWGFGERSFHWMWNCIVKEMPNEFSFLEVGVFRGQVLSLIGLLAKLTHRKANIFGVTPLSSIGVDWESDYEKDIERIHDQFNLNKDYTLIRHNSTHMEAIKEAAQQCYDIVFIDGGHDYDTVKMDLRNYTPLVKQGGYLVIDDSACKFHMPFGYFQGIADVSKAVDEELPNEEFEELFNIVHNRIFRRIK